MSEPKPMIVADGEHTPGPWKVDDSEGDVGVLVVIDQNRRYVCVIQHDPCVSEEDKANATLIANAPETAAELERLRQERAQMGLRIFVAEKELKKIALNHAEPARSGVVAAIGALNGDFPNGAKGTELEMDRPREINRDQAAILADLREWMSVAGMAVEKDADMLFVLKGRFDALESAVALERSLAKENADTADAAEARCSELVEDKARLDWLESRGIWVGDLCVPGLEEFRAFCSTLRPNGADDAEDFETEAEGHSARIREAIDWALARAKVSG